MKASSLLGTVQQSLNRIQRSCLDRSATAQSYEEARAELGGGAWREAPKSTDAWFVIDNESDPSAESGDAPCQTGGVSRPRARVRFVGLTCLALLVVTCVALKARTGRAPVVVAAIAGPSSPAAPVAASTVSLVGVDTVAARMADSELRAPLRPPTQKRTAKVRSRRH